MNGPGPAPPDRPARGGPEIPAWTAFVVFMFAVTMGYAASGLALYAVAWLQAGKVPPGSTAVLLATAATIPGLLAVVGAIAVTEILVVLSALRSLRAPAREALRLAPSAAGPGVLALAAVAMLLLSHALDTSVHIAGLADDGTLGRLREVFANAPPAALLASVAVVGLLAATAEELLFRGFMQTRLTARLGPAAGVTVTSIFFGLAHFDPVQGGAAVLLGIYLGAITEWSGSLRPAILCHILNNTLGTLAPAMIDGGGETSFQYASLAVSTGGLAVLLPWLRRRLRPVPLRAG
ncbi:MAG: CPBP family intramembrane metalloprotease [Deltaproteobacteria bacterium]|nr:CPBP family intramembrane metalloprotease [Deltaproteobacteria bacterium]